jgi:predicted aspartyl protease|tara:strand:- start:128 stop:565 length:438 start_codon:yes stop_codon:yes gene_type:complete
LRQLRNLLQEGGFYRIPLKKTKSGHYTFSAKINAISGIFILDTGASSSCIGFNNDSYFNLNNEESLIKAAGAGAINMKTEIAKNNSIAIGSWKISHFDFVIFDLSHVNEALNQVDETPIHGIIGADFLKKTRAVIDYGRNCFYLK